MNELNQLQQLQSQLSGLGGSQSQLGNSQTTGFMAPASTIGTCPHCGRCPYCGRGIYNWPPCPQPNSYPMWTNSTQGTQNLSQAAGNSIN